MPWYPVKDLEETRHFYLERYVTKYQMPQGYAYAICLNTDNIPIGYIQVDAEEPHDLGYGLRKEFWHRGIVTEAAMAVIYQGLSSSQTLLSRISCGERSVFASPHGRPFLSP